MGHKISFLKIFTLILFFFLALNEEVIAQDSEQFTVTGIVTDKKGLPIPGVNVIQKNSNSGVVTNFDGIYSIEIPKGSTIVFSFVGYLSQKVLVSNQNEINIQLVEGVSSLDEVVVIGYGTQKRRDITGSVTSVGGEELRSATSTSFADALRGKAAGVLITSGSGEPGSNLNIQIRGTSSISASSSPLYVIDGIPVEGGGSDPSGVNPLSYLDPNSIESIEVLKDASAAAIYGSRGAAGVVLITTKSSNPSGKTRISFNSTFGISTFNGGYDLLNAPLYAEYMRNIRPDNALYTNQETGEPILYDESDMVDWQDLLIQDAPTQTYNIGLRSGNRDNNLYVGLGYSNTEGVVINSAFKRYSLVLNSNTKISDKLSFAMRTNTGYTIRDGQIGGTGGGASAGILNRIFTSRPVNADIVDSQGDPNYTNPLKWLSLTENKNFNLRSNVNASLSYDIIDNLTFKITGGGFISNSKDKYFVSKEVINSANLNGNAELGSTNQVNWLNENTLTYRGSSGAHSVEALLGFTQQQNIEEGFGLRVNDFPAETNRADAIQNALAVPSYDSNKIRWALQSYLGRVIYSFDEKYILTSSLRIDGSSKFIGTNKYSVFPAFALAWQIADEKFLEKFDNLEQLKLRVGYGRLGNQSIRPYSALGRTSTEYYYYGDTRAIGASYSSIPNRNLKWETSETINAGVDINLYNGRINMTLDGYVKNTKDLLLNAPIAGSSGYQSIFQNVGSLRNNGVEFALSTVNIDTEDFTWKTDFNISANKNEVINLGTQDNILIGNLPHTSSSPNVLAEGYPIGSIYGYIFEGLYREGDFDADGNLLEGIPAFGVPQPGFMRFKDIGGPNGTPDGVVNALDRTVIGNPNPKHFGGLGNTFTYKNFDLNIFFQWQYGHELFNWSTFFLSGTSANNLRRDIYLNQYTAENTDTNIPTYLDRNATSNISSYYMEDASFLRLQNITLSYSLGKKTLDNIGLDSASLGLIIDNLFLWTNYSGLDPEQTSYGQNTGTDYFGYPRPRTFSLNLNVIL